jgi:Fe-Mn family superoxide dismutase
MAFELPALPYDRNSLEPHLSSETLDYHYGRLHRAHVTALNALVEGTAHEGLSLEQILSSSTGELFAQAAEAWNHAFYWHCLAPKGSGAPTGALAEAIIAGFGDVSTFKQALQASVRDDEASGWIWLLKRQDHSVEIVDTGNADTPIAHGQIPLLAIDVNEHAYSIDYGHSCKHYLEGIWQVINWNFIAQNFTTN